MHNAADITRTVAGIIGNIVAGLLFLAPLPTFVHICKKGSVEQFSAAPYLLMLVNSMSWLLYGLPMVHPDNLLVLTVETVGCVIEFVYVAIFLIYSDRRKRLTVALCLLAELVFIATLVSVTLNLVHTYKTRSTIVGTACLVFNIVMYASPLSVMKLVITTKSVEYMPLSLSLAILANGVFWSIYALMPFDVFILISNAFGLVLSVVQLILYATYYKSTKPQTASSKEVLDLSEVVVSNGNGNGNGEQDPRQQDQCCSQRPLSL